MNVLFDPTVLFFVLGIFVGIFKSSVSVPAQISKFLGIYLLVALGVKCGVSVSNSSFNAQTVFIAVIGLLALIISSVGYMLFRKFFERSDTTAASAVCESISPVTLVVAFQYLILNGTEFSGTLATVVTLIEGPAIIISVALVSLWCTGRVSGLKGVARESFTDKTFLLLLLGLVIGFVTDRAGMHRLEPLTIDIFKWVLAFILLDMGLRVAERFPALRGKSSVLLSYAIAAPVCCSLLVLVACELAGISDGDTILLMAMAGGASYTTVPFVIRHTGSAIGAQVHHTLTLCLSFPFNILIGIPLYAQIVHRLN
jgi:hypothetical protein